MRILFIGDIFAKVGRDLVKRAVPALVRRHAIATLNVAGPRASEEPAIGAFVYRCVRALLSPARPPS